MSEFISSKVIKKRKPAACIWCGENIGKGERAIEVVFADNGDIASCYWHPECDAAYQEDAKKYQTWGEPFEPYEFARGSNLCKHDYRIMKEREQAAEQGVQFDVD